MPNSRSGLPPLGRWRLGARHRNARGSAIRTAPGQMATVQGACCSLAFERSPTLRALRVEQEQLHLPAVAGHVMKEASHTIALAAGLEDLGSAETTNLVARATAAAA